MATALIAPPLDDGTAQGTAKESTPLEALPLAPEGVAAEEAARKEAAALAARKRYEEDQATLRALRMALRWIMDKLFQARRWESFFEPVDPNEDSSYWELVKEPMDLSTLLARVDQRRYMTAAQFLADVALIPAGERQYWNDLPAGVRHISRACALEDEARSLVETAVPAELRSRLEKILAAGGPAPAPEGLHTAMGLLEDGTMPQPAKGKGAKGKEDEAPVLGRRPSRLAGDEISNRIIHTDPEAQRRRIKALKRSESGVPEGKQKLDKAAVEEEPIIAIVEGSDMDLDAEDEQITAMEDVEGAPATVTLPSAVDVDAAAPVGKSNKEGTAIEEEAEEIEICMSPLPSANQNGEPCQHVDGISKREKGINTSKAGQAKPVAAIGAPLGEHEQVLSDSQRSQITILSEKLAECTGGLSLEGLEEIHAQLGRLAYERRNETDREMVADAAVVTAIELSNKLYAAMRGQ